MNDMQMSICSNERKKVAIMMLKWKRTHQYIICTSYSDSVFHTIFFSFYFRLLKYSQKNSFLFQYFFLPHSLSFKIFTLSFKIKLSKTRFEMRRKMEHFIFRRVRKKNDFFVRDFF